MKNKIGFATQLLFFAKHYTAATMVIRLVKRIGLLTAFILLLNQATFSQIGIGGPTCVKPGETYTYFITGNFRIVNHQWCVIGGIINGNISSQCVQGVGFLSVTVRWNSPGSGSLTVRGSDGTASITPTITDPLLPGSVYTAGGLGIKWQIIEISTIPGTIFCTAPSGGNCGTTYNYQWQSSPDNSNWSNTPGATGENFTFSAPLPQTTYYRRIVTGAASNQSGASDVATVIVYLPLNGGIINNTSQTINYNTTPAAFSTTAATDGNCEGNYSYQWQSSTDNVNFYNIAGGNSPDYAPDILTTTTYFRRMVTCGSVVRYTNTAVINVYPPLQPGSINPSVQAINYNTVPATLIVSGVSGGSGTFSYQWQVSTDGNNFNDIGGATGASYAPSAILADSYYRVLVGSNGVYHYSSTATITVNPPSGGTITPAYVNIASGTSPGDLTANAASIGNCTYSYQWQQSADGSNWNDIGGATGQNYTPGVLSATTWFRRRVSCGAVVAYTNICTVTIVSATSCNVNYVQERIFTQAGITNKAIADGITTPASVKQTTQYIDGFGRLLQTVSKQAGRDLTTGDFKDIVIPVVYDGIGRENTKYLPYVANAADGNYRCNPLPEQKSFNAVQFPGEQYYYGQIDFEASPLSRVERTYAPGSSWLGSSRGVGIRYQVNTAVDDVKIWSVNNVAGSWGTYAVTGVYTEGQLYKNVNVDEKGNQVIEFKDKEDRIILKKVQLTAAPDNGGGTDYTNWLCTYYIYDDLNLLRAVVQPVGVQLLIQNSWNINALNGDILNEQCFRYEYDERKRLTRRKMPGTGESYMVYDVRDRLVFTQDANLRQNSQWLVTLYDNKNRLVLTALTTYGGSASDLQHDVDLKSNGVTYPPGVQRDIVLPMQGQALPITGGWQAYNSITLNTGFESGNDFTAEVVSGTTGGSGESIIEGMTISNDPLPGGTQLDVLTKTGYDNYTTIPAQSSLSGIIDNAYTTSSYLNTSYNSFPFADPVVQSNQTRGMTTWTQTRVLGTNQFLYSVNIFDEKGRMIQMKSRNSTGGSDVTTMQYTFSGQVLVTVQKQEKLGSSNPQTHIVVTKNTYSALGQVTAITKKINSVINGVPVVKPEVTIATHEYDPIGQLKEKNIGQQKDAWGNYTSTAVQKLIYDYNIRGWLLGVNREYLTTAGQTNDGILFGFELGYDKTANKAGQNFTSSQYNGNITGMLWKSDGDDIRRKYDYGYDAASRLLKGDFVQQNDDDHLWNNAKVDFSMKLGNGIDPWQAYDANGNIQRMQQWGLTLTGKAQVDDMVYSYFNNSNKLSSIAEQGAAAIDTKLGDFTDKNTGIDYGYDANGNLVSDRNKRLNGATGSAITSGGALTYNHLNQMQNINVADDQGNAKGTIKYVYDAGGNKLQKITTENNVTVHYNNANYAGSITTTTTYLGGVIYESKEYDNASLAGLAYIDKLQFMMHEEGRVRYIDVKDNTPAHFENDYFIKDHLGNTRMVLTEELQQDIYPAATLEGNLNTTTDAVYTENQYYNINPANIVNKPANATTYKNKNGGPLATDPPVNNNPYGNATANSQKMYKLKAEGGVGVTGLGMALKVMSGDRIDILGKTYYADDNTTGTNYDVPVLDVLTGLLGAPSGAAAGKAATPAGLNGIPGIYNGVYSFLTNQNRGAGTKPKAYINWILLDENFKYVNGNFQRVDQPNTVEDRNLSAIPVLKNGYLYVYASNESNVAVYFDNLQVIHTKGPILEETHYYPFGLMMAGISSKAIKPNYSENKYQFGGKELQSMEFSDGIGLNWYDYQARTFDPQTGRWNSMDPLGEISRRWSPYHYAYNNPMRFTDPDGMEATDFNDDDMVNYITVQNKQTGETKTYITGVAEKGTAEYHVTGLSGGQGVPFRSKDEAAFAWSLENANAAKSGQNERAGAIYSKDDGKKGKSYSYNGSYEGSSSRSDYHEKDIPRGAKLEGLIHTHPTQWDFSKHVSVEDRNQSLDADYMNDDDHVFTDFYLVNPKGQLLVSRRADPTMPGSGSRGDSEVLVSGLKTGHLIFNLKFWQGPDGRPLKSGEIPESLKKYQKKKE